MKVPVYSISGKTGKSKVGSGALTLRNAIIIAAVFEFCGAFFAGDAVTDTVRKGVLVISEEEMAHLSRELQYGFIAAMLAAAGVLAPTPASAAR